MAYQNGKTYYIIPLCATGDAAYNQKILSKQVQPLSLNTRGAGNHYNNRNVNVYSLDWSTDMQWKVMVYDGFARILCAGDTSYGLDYYYGSSNPGNCDIYKVSGNDEDSKINFRTINASENLYRIQCYRNNADNNLYLTATGTANGADVRWQPLDSSKAAYQTWWLVPIENVSANTPATPTVPTTPNEIKDQEFFVKAYGTNLNLNVYGTDTVANARNVNVYAKENCLAQKWIAKQTAAGPKLFTSINQSYALNINTADNNCTMYTASGNDTDSVLAFEEVADMLYRIKMNNHNKYLRVDTGATSGSNVYWVSDINSATYWEFIPEDVMFPSEPEVPSSPDAPTAIVGNTYAVQANGTSYYLNVYGTDTVADGRNVNIYSKEDCLAQRWVIRNTENGPKLFTKINENFALNIDTSTDNCSMYTAAGNDNDSLLEFYPVGNMLYRIKMYNHNKYLCIDGTAATGTNVKWIEGATFATVWKLIPENNMTYDDVTDTDTTPDSSLVSSDRFLAMPAGYFMVGRDGHAISEITIHHTAGVVSSIENIRTGWINGDDVVSAHYCVKDNDIVQFVKERNTAYANGGTLKNPSAGNPNLKAVTIETCNSGGEAAGWPVSEASLENLIKLVADIAKRNNMGTLVVGQNLKTHQDHAYTICPGPYLLARMQDIADRANKINNATYIRKHNTNLYLGVNSNNEIIWTDRDGAKGWNKVEADGEYTFYDIDDASMCLQVADDGVTPILASKNTVVFRVVGIENERGLINLGVVNSMATYGIADTVKNWISGILSTVGVAVPAATENNPDEFICNEEDLVYNSLVSSELRDKNVRIKYKFPSSDTYYYLTISDEEDPMSFAENVKIDFLPFDEEDPKQIWKIKHYGGGFYGLSSFAYPKYSIEIDPASNTVVANYRSILDSADFDNSILDDHYMIKEPYNKLLRNIGISILPSTDSKGEYTIKSSAYDKYLYCYHTSSNTIITWSNAEPLGWNIEEAEYIVVNGWLRLYLNPQNREISHETLVPKYAFRVPYGVITNKADGKGLITYEEHYYNNYTDFIQTSRGTKTIEVEYRAALPEEIEYDSTATEYDYVTAYTKQNSSGKDIKYTFNCNKNWSAFENKRVVSSNTDVDKYGKTVDDNGVVFATKDGYKDYYYVAVGPKVIKKEYYPDNGTPGNDMYNVCTIDAVLSKDNNLYYIPCLVGDVKGHTWNNGVIQTHYCYYVPKDIKDHGEDKTLTYHEFDTKNIDGCKSDINPEIACLEFIGSNPGNSNFKNYNFEKFVVYNDD